jgi:hydroxymethylpyrimidine/phosphomethylpyrimidine kinase
MRAQGERILAFGPRAVLVKGGHAEGTESVDVLVEASGVRRFGSPRVATRNTHGTGCTLSSAIAAGLAKGLGLDEAVAGGKAFVSAAIGRSDRLRIAARPSQLPCPLSLTSRPLAATGPGLIALGRTAWCPLGRPYGGAGR